MAYLSSNWKEPTAVLLRQKMKVSRLGSRIMSLLLLEAAYFMRES